MMENNILISLKVADNANDSFFQFKIGNACTGDMIARTQALLRNIDKKLQDAFDQTLKISTVKKRSATKETGVKDT